MGPPTSDGIGDWDGNGNGAGTPSCAHGVDSCISESFRNCDAGADLGLPMFEVVRKLDERKITPDPTDKFLVAATFDRVVGKKTNTILTIRNEFNVPTI